MCVCVCVCEKYNTELSAHKYKKQKANPKNMLDGWTPFGMRLFTKTDEGSDFPEDQLLNKRTFTAHDVTIHIWVSLKTS